MLGRGKVLGCMLVVAVLLTGGARWPTGHWEGGPIEPLNPPPAAIDASVSSSSATTAPTRLRLATFNIRSCTGMDNVCDVARTASLLHGYDLVSLHEVRGWGPWWKNQASALGDQLGERGIYSPTELWWWHPWFGNGILTRTRIDHWERMRLPSGFRDAYRNVLFLKVPFGSGSLNVLMAHLGKKENRMKQFPIVADMFLKLPSPAVLMGDLNTRPWEPMMRRLLEQPGVEDVIGQRTKPRDRVEFILTKDLRCRDAGLVENRVSDHPLIWAELEAK